MNIFILSWIIDHCVKYHCDRHVIKMILETVQLLSTCHHVVNPEKGEKWHQEGKIYKKTHMNHPCSIWLRECRENYIWLCRLGIALCEEYAYRYDKKPSDHKCYSKLIFLKNNIPDLKSNNGRVTQPKLAMPDKYKTDDPVESYRIYYINDKARMLYWKKREAPYWVPENLRSLHYEKEKERLNK